jgi:hypothetical protein
MAALFFALSHCLKWSLQASPRQLHSGTHFTSYAGSKESRRYIHPLSLQKLLLKSANRTAATGTVPSVDFRPTADIQRSSLTGRNGGTLERGLGLTRRLEVENSANDEQG